MVDEGNRTFAEADRLYKVAYEHFIKDDFRLCIPELEEVIRKRPHHYDAHLCLGISFSRSRQYDRAVHELETLLRLRSDDARAYNCLAIAYFNKAGKIKSRPDLLASAHFYREALKVDPKSVRTLNGLALAQWYLNDYEEALKTIVTTLDEAPRDYQTNRNYCWLHSRMLFVSLCHRDFARARQILRKAWQYFFNKKDNLPTQNQARH